MGVDMDEVSQTERYEAGHYRDAVLHGGRRARRHRGGPGAAPHQGRRTPSRRTSRRPQRSPTRSRRRRRAARRRRPGPVPLQAVLPRLRSRHRDPHVVRRRDDRALLHLRLQRLLRQHRALLGLRGQAGLEGRLADALGLRARRLRAGRHGPRDARLVVHRRARARRGHLRHAAAGVVRLRVRGLRRRPEDVVVGGRRPDRRGRAADPRGADPALALRAPQPAARPSTSTSGPRSSGSTTSGTRWAARPPTPARRDAQVLAFERAVATVDGRASCPRPRSS